MPYKEKEIEKLYYPIGEVAEMFKVSPSLLRFWEKEFDILKPRKNRKGDRLFTRKDLANLKIIHHLVREKGYTLKGAKQHLKAGKSETKRRAEAIQSLQKIKSFLEELKKQL